jgi:prepilin-type N-terminal cleavage/methylation domain-containing protein
MASFQVRRQISDRLAGFTLMELVVVIAVIGVLITLGTQIFYRSIRGSSSVEVKQALDRGTEHIVNSLTRSLPAMTVVSLQTINGTKYRADCLSAGSSGLSGIAVVMKDLSGVEVSYSLSGKTFMAGSNSLNDEADLEISSLDFVWYCDEVAMDRLSINFLATAKGDSAEAVASKSYGFDLLLRNSGK